MQSIDTMTNGIPETEKSQQTPLDELTAMIAQITEQIAAINTAILAMQTAAPTEPPTEEQADPVNEE